MNPHPGPDSFGSFASLRTAGGPVGFFRLDRLATELGKVLDRLPFSIRILLESLLRGEDGRTVRRDDIAALAGYDPSSPAGPPLPFRPARVLLQDFTGVPVLVDLAAMRSAAARMGADPRKLEPRIRTDLVADHSVQVDCYGTPEALARNVELEFARNRERYSFLRWAQGAFRRLRIHPPGVGICHQVNLESIARVVWHEQREGLVLAYPDSLVGSDSHTTTVNGLGVLGWGVGGIEAEAAMLGQAITMLPPPVVGVRLHGRLPDAATATDLVLVVTERLRQLGVVGKFVEFSGPGLASLSVPDRATVANMSPENGSTVGYFPPDDQTLTYLRATGRPAELLDLVERYTKTQGLFRSADTPEPNFSQVLDLDLSTVRGSLAGPSRPQDRVALPRLKRAFRESLRASHAARGFRLSDEDPDKQVPFRSADGESHQLGHGSVVIAAITSCTNTSNPSVMLAAGLLAQAAVERGLRVRPWVKTSLGPGSRVVTRYLDRAGLLPALETLGFHVVGYGCTTCIGNSGPLPVAVAQAVQEHDLVSAAVVSGNRNFEGRINPLVRSSWLASPPLVVAYALAGTVDIDLSREPLGRDPEGRPVYLADIWPSAQRIRQSLQVAQDPQLFRSQYQADEASHWQALPAPRGSLYPWDAESTYIQEPPFFLDMRPEPDPIRPIVDARMLLLLGDSVTTDHISPAGAIEATGPAGTFLQRQGVRPEDFNSFGSRRGNDRVMTRGTFGNIRIRNLLAPGTEGGWTTHLPSGEVLSVYEAARRYAAAKIPCVVIAGKDYGMGSSRDWAAKGASLLGVRAVLAESFERIHRSNLVGMGVLPLQLPPGESASSLGIRGLELLQIRLDEDLRPGQTVLVTLERSDGRRRSVETRCRIDTPEELSTYRHGGILQAMLRGFLEEQGGERARCRPDADKAT